MLEAFLIGFVALQAGAGVDAAVLQVPVCAGLSGEARVLAGELLASEHPYDCCDDTLATCLQREPVCSLARRLAASICRRVAEGQDKARIRRALARRARSMMTAGNTRASIGLDGVPRAGSDDAPVTLVVYACGRCRYCAKITPLLHRAVTEGRLRGKAELYFKVFPLRGHEFAKEAGLGFLAAASMGGFWAYMHHFYAEYDSFSPAAQIRFARRVGLDPVRFEQLLADKRLERRLVASKKEGVVNNVEATPTLFINNRKYFGEMKAAELVDVVEEEFERIRGKAQRD